jgi:hypothetical protein
VEGNATQTFDSYKYQNSPNTNNELDSYPKLQQPFSIERNPSFFENHMENQLPNSGNSASLFSIANSTHNITTANINELYNEKTNSNVLSLFILSSEEKNAKYFEKRKKNNESAKKSRQARIKREQDLMNKVLLLDKQNLALKTQVNVLKEKLKQHRLRFMKNFFSI